jgi:hypothetical protein
MMASTTTFRTRTMGTATSAGLATTSSASRCPWFRRIRHGSWACGRGQGGRQPLLTALLQRALRRALGAGARRRQADAGETYRRNWRPLSPRRPVAPLCAPSDAGGPWPSRGCAAPRRLPARALLACRAASVAQPVPLKPRCRGASALQCSHSPWGGPRADARGKGTVGHPRCLNTSLTPGPFTTASTLRRPPQPGQVKTSKSKLRFSSVAQSNRAARCFLGTSAAPAGASTRPGPSPPRMPCSAST